MLDFHFPTLSDKQWVKQTLAKSQYFGCEYSFGNIFLWSNAYQTRIAKYKDFFLSKSGTDHYCYCFPAGEGDFRDAIQRIYEDSQQCGKSFCMYGVTKQAIDMLEQLMPGAFDYVPSRNDFDYIYLSEDLMNLAGKKYHAKRNHIARFIRENDWSYEDITKQNISECRAFNRRWEQEKGSGATSSVLTELEMVDKALDYFEELNLSGGLLRVNGEVVAYTFGEEITSQIFCVHVEKALANVNGAYPMINREFAVRNLSKYRYINREEDVGVEGLRKAKLSYHPSILLEKYIAVFRG